MFGTSTVNAAPVLPDVQCRINPNLWKIVTHVLECVQWINEKVGKKLWGRENFHHEKVLPAGKKQETLLY